jgi:membrane peptidoglycan carboxypeptidase
MSALVAQNPENGQVIAYYGGDDANGYDYAGLNTEKDGSVSGGHSPGSTMKVYTLAAALADGISLDSTWDARQITKTDATHPYKVGNANRSNAAVAAKCGGSASYCPLKTALIQSFNVPFFYVTQQIGPDKVIRMAQKAGIQYLWDNDNHGHKLADQSGDWGRNPFDYPVGYGQYGLTVFDHATGMATFANRGVYNAPHFITKVEQRQLDGSYKELPELGEHLDPQPRIDQSITDEVTGTMKKVPATHDWRLDGNRQVAAKTGTWELSSTSKDNAHAWVVGFTKQIAVAVWVGNKGDLKPIRYANGDTISSGNMPGDIWLEFLNAASKGMAKEDLPDADGSVGSDDRGNGFSPSPSASPTPLPSESPCTEPCPTASPAGDPASPSPATSPSAKKSPSPKPTTLQP